MTDYTLGILCLKGVGVICKRMGTFKAKVQKEEKTVVYWDLFNI